MANSFSGHKLFSKAYDNTKHQIKTSLILLLCVTLVFSIVMYFAEITANKDYNFIDALIWTFVKYVEDPADIVSPPVTFVGQVVGTLVGVLGIAIFAVPAGLIGSGLTEAMNEIKREEELDIYHSRIIKAFRRCSNSPLRLYLDTLPDKGGKKYARLNFVPQNVRMERLQLRQGIDLKDVFEVIKKNNDLRVKNRAERFVVELFPKNRPYGYYKNRNSNVTIVCPTGYSEVGIGWYAYYLAKFGGFNFVCKEVEVDPDELDSFYNLSEKPLYNKRPIEDFENLHDKESQEARRILKEKQQCRDAYIEDIRKSVKNEHSWIIVVNEHERTDANTFDFHISDRQKDGTQITTHDHETFVDFRTEFVEQMKANFDLVTDAISKRYPLKLKKGVSSNILYFVKEKGIHCNGFSIRPSTRIVRIREDQMVILFQWAQLLSKHFDNNKGITDDDVEDFSTLGFGFKKEIC